MALINCPECNQVMSDAAKVCPHCFKPRQIQKKPCRNCGFEIEAKKRVCPECGSNQYQGSTAKKTISDMAPKKSNSSPLNFRELLGGIITGGLLVYLLLPYLGTSEPIDSSFATVKKVNGLYVFIESFPKNEYSVVATYKGKSMVDTWNSLGIGKKKAGNVILNMLEAGQDNVVFYRKLAAMTEKVRIDFPQAQAVIIGDQMNSCEVIKFK